MHLEDMILCPWWNEGSLTSCVLSLEAALGIITMDLALFTPKILLSFVTQEKIKDLSEDIFILAERKFITS